MPHRNDYSSAGKKLYVGPYLETGLSSDTLREHFAPFGPIEAVWVARNPPGFAFVTFEDPRDAEEASYKLNGTDFMGKRVRVEVARGSRNVSGGHYGDRRELKSVRAGPYATSTQRRRRSPSYGGENPTYRGSMYPSADQYRRYHEPSPLRGGSRRDGNSLRESVLVNTCERHAASRSPRHDIFRRSPASNNNDSVAHSTKRNHSPPCRDSSYTDYKQERRRDYISRHEADTKRARDTATQNEDRDDCRDDKDYHLSASHSASVSPKSRSQSRQARDSAYHDGADEPDNTRTTSQRPSSTRTRRPSTMACDPLEDGTTIVAPEPSEPRRTVVTI